MQLKILSFPRVVGKNGPSKSIAIFAIGNLGITFVKSTYLGSFKDTLLQAEQFLTKAFTSVLKFFQK